MCASVEADRVARWSLQAGVGSLDWGGSSRAGEKWVLKFGGSPSFPDAGL